MLTSVYMFISIPASFLTPIIADKMKNQSLLGVIIAVLYDNRYGIFDVLLPTLSW